MLTTVQSTLASMLTPDEKLLVGVSGGADSVALLDVLVKSGWRPHVCHLNHQLRGADSDADAEFVRQLAGKYGLPATIEARKVEPTEDAARRARFDFFQSVAERTGIAKLALAHTADDQVETFLLRLLRGAGVPGLVGIWPERQIGALRVIRPLLEVRRSEIKEYLVAEKLACREDASNADTRFTRNRIRHELLPLLESEFNPAIRDVLLRTAEILRDEDELLASLAGDVPIAKLRQQPVALQRRALKLWLGEEIGFDHIEAVRELPVGGEVTLPGELIVYREPDGLRKATRRELSPVQGRWPLSVEGETTIRELDVKFVAASRLAAPRAGSRLKGLQESFDADALGTGLFVRTWQEGDRFQPLGMTGEKKLQDFFVDEKVPRHQRGRTPLLCATDGRIAWVVGCRIAEPFKITEHTRRVLQVSFRG